MITPGLPLRPDDPAAPLPPAAAAPFDPIYASPYGGSDSGSFTLWGLLRIVRRKWLTILAVVILFGGAAHLYLKRAPRIYSATSLIELSIRRPRIVTQQSAVIEDSTQGYEEILNTKLSKLQSADNLPVVLAAYRAYRPEDVRSDEVLMRELGGRANYTLLRRTRLVRITVLHPDRRFAADACQAYAQAAERSARDENRSTSDEAVEWLQGQVESQRRDVETKDAAILTFRQANQLDALKGQRKSVDEGLVQINSTRVAVESRRAQENEVLEALGKPGLSPECAGQLPGSMPRAAEVDAAIGKWNTARLEQEAMLAVYTLQHPALAGRVRLVELARAQAVEALARAQATAAANVQLLDHQGAALRAIAETQTKLSGELELKIVERTIRLDALSRARDASDNAYRGLLTRMQEARLAADETTATVKLVNSARVSGRPVSPHVTIIYALALLVGLAVGGALVFVVDSLEDYITSPEDVEKASGLPVLAVLPHMKAKTRIAVARATLDKGTAPLVEAFAGLRSMLDASQYKGRSQVILMFSSLPGEGKTVVASNLASAFAHSGQKTLLIDFDLRRPRLHIIFPSPKDAFSLADALDGESEAVSFEQLAYDGGTPNLSVVANRPGVASAPVDRVAGRRAAELLEWARSRYDRIVLDAPPVGLVSDGFVLAGMSDMVLLVTRVDASRRQAISHTLRRLYDMGVMNAAAVVGDVHFARRFYGKAAYYQYQKDDVSAPRDTRGTE